jgi:ribosome-binding ATPase YchF (GTP1/OBG family)
MKIGIVGYQRSGKSTLFHWLTGHAPDPSLSHTGQSAMAPIPDPRIVQLCKIYNPKKVTQAAIEIVDTPGLNRKHEGNAAKLGTLREAGCIVFVVSALLTPIPATFLVRRGSVAGRYGNRHQPSNGWKRR